MSLRLERVAQKDDGGFQIHKAVLLLNSDGLSIYNTSSDVDIEQLIAKTATAQAEVTIEFNVAQPGLYKLYVSLNDRPIRDIFFLESRASNKLQSPADEQLSTTQQSLISQDTDFNSSKMSAYVKRPKSSFRLSSKVLIKADGKLVAKNGSIQPMRKSEVLVEEAKKPNVKDLIASNKGKLEKLLKAKKTVLPSIKRVI